MTQTNVKRCNTTRSNVSTGQEQVTSGRTFAWRMIFQETCSRKSHNSNLNSGISVLADHLRVGLMLTYCIHVLTLMLEQQADHFVHLVLITNVFINEGYYSAPYTKLQVNGILRCLNKCAIVASGYNLLCEYNLCPKKALNKRCIPPQKGSEL